MPPTLVGRRLSLSEFFSYFEAKDTVGHPAVMARASHLPGKGEEIPDTLVIGCGQDNHLSSLIASNLKLTVKRRLVIEHWAVNRVLNHLDETLEWTSGDFVGRRGKSKSNLYPSISVWMIVIGECLELNTDHITW